LTCEELETLLHAFVDGELDLVRSLEVECHLQGCQACARAVRGHQALQTTLRDPALYHRPPAGLEERVRASLRAGLASPSIAEPRPVRIAPFWRPLALAASVALVAVLVWGILRGESQPSADQLLAQQVASSHARSLMESHIVDVASSDQHTVKPWFTKRLDFAPPVKNLADNGFPLVGGRLDYLDNRQAAALVYKRNLHDINLFIWPSARRAARSPEVVAVPDHPGYQLIHWTDGDLTYWAVSDLNEKDLREFVRLVQGG
jgi:anti-sigma factor RsiW